MPNPNDPPRPSIVEKFIARVHETMGAPALPYSLLRPASDDGPVQPVLWIPLSFTQRAPDRSTSRLRDAGVSRRPLALEQWTLEAHITGETLADAEATRARLLQAVQEALGPLAELRGGEWVTQDQGDTRSKPRARETVVQRFEWTMHVFPPDVQDVGIEAFATGPSSRNANRPAGRSPQRRN